MLERGILKHLVLMVFVGASETANQLTQCILSCCTVQNMPTHPCCCFQFDDEEMIPRKETEIVELSGGGDWHMAYLLLYKAIRVKG